MYAHAGMLQMATIEKLSNGFIVRFMKAQKVAVKQKGLEAFGFNPEMQNMIKIGIDKLKQGDEWKPEFEEHASDDVAKPVAQETWTIVPIAMACANEADLMDVIKKSIVAHDHIEKLKMDGELGNYYGPIAGLSA